MYFYEPLMVYNWTLKKIECRDIPQTVEAYSYKWERFKIYSYCDSIFIKLNWLTEENGEEKTATDIFRGMCCV